MLIPYSINSKLFVNWIKFNHAFNITRYWYCGCQIKAFYASFKLLHNFIVKYPQIENNTSNIKYVFHAYFISNNQQKPKYINVPIINKHENKKINSVICSNGSFCRNHIFPHFCKVAIL
jgi:hypothetical protein